MNQSQQTATDITPAEENLAGSDFSGQDLRGIDLSGRDLRNSRFFRTDLRGANLHGANLEGAEFAGANLEDANLEGVNACRAGFGQANLHRANLFVADLSEATLTQANLSGANLHCVNLKQGRLREADLSHADLSEANLYQVDMSLATVNQTNFSNADLRHTRLRMLRKLKKANWIGVDIRDVNFAGAYMVRREIIDQNFIKEFRSYNRLNSLLYYPWRLTCDCGRSMILWFFWIAVQAVIFAWFYTLVGVNYGAYPTDLSPLYFSIVTLTTLGFGDVVPTNLTGQLVVICEVCVGYLMLGGLLSIFSNKLARRGD